MQHRAGEAAARSQEDVEHHDHTRSATGGTRKSFGGQGEEGWENGRWDPCFRIVGIQTHQIVLGFEFR
jgi:hypothetical protein